MIGFVAYWAIIITFAAMLVTNTHASFIEGDAARLRGDIADIEAELAPRKRGRKPKRKGDEALERLVAKWPWFEEVVLTIKERFRHEPPAQPKLTAERRAELEARKVRLEALLPHAERRSAIANKVRDIALVAVTISVIVVAVIGSVGLL